MMSTYGVDRVIGSPQQILALAELRETHPGYRLDALNMVRISGAFASRDAVRRVQASLCRNVVIDYGSTEASLVAWAPYEMIADIPGAVGFIGPWCELEIVDETHRPLPAGQEGLIRYPHAVLRQEPRRQQFRRGGRCPVVLPGRSRLPDRKRRALHPRPRRRRHQLRRLESFGREPLTRCCSSAPASAMRRSVGIKGESGLEELWIGLVPKPGFQLTEFQRELEQDPKFGELLLTVGAEVISVDVIPRNQLGKIQRGELREKLLAAQKKAAPR